MPETPGPTAPSCPSPGAGPSEPGAQLHVVSLGGAATAGAAASVAAFGPEVPIGGDYVLIPPLAGAQRVDAGWLWARHNEHRVPLMKLLVLAGYRLTGNDFRAGMFTTVALLGALAAGLILVAGALRGGGRYTDAFFPILLLRPGHQENLLWSIQFGIALSATMATALLMLVVVRGGWPGPGRAAVAAALLAALPLCFSSGLAAVPALMAWLWGAAVAHWRSGGPRGRQRALAILAMTAPALASLLLYFRGYRRPPNQFLPGGPAETLRTTLRFLSLALGPATKPLGLAWWAVVPAFLLVAIRALAGAWSRRPADRARVAGLFACLAGNLALALGVGWGRSGGGELAGLQDRYVILAAPSLIVVAFACGLYGGATIRRLVPMILLALAPITLWPNAQAGLAHGRRLAARVAAFQQDLRAGVPLHRLLKRHTPFLHPQPDVLAGYLRQLRAAGIGPFRAL